MFAQSMRYAICETYRLADFNLTPVWSGMGNKIVKLDAVNALGQRTLRFSQCKQEMVGYDLNLNYPITTILRVSPLAELNREKLSATVFLLWFNTSMNLQNINRLPFFCLIVSLGTVSDIMYNPDGILYKYQPINKDLNVVCKPTLSDWHSNNDILPVYFLSV